MKKALLSVLLLLLLFISSPAKAFAYEEETFPVRFKFKVYTSLGDVATDSGKGDYIEVISEIKITQREQVYNSEEIIKKIRPLAEAALKKKTSINYSVVSLVRPPNSIYYGTTNNDYATLLWNDEKDYMLLLVQTEAMSGKPNAIAEVTINLFASKYGPLNGWHVFNGAERFYENNVYKMGFQTIGKTTYIFDSNGKKLKGWQKIYNGPSGEFNSEYYLDPKTGGMWTGLRKVGNTKYLFHNKGHKLYGWHRLNGKDYYFDPDYGGGMVTGRRQIRLTTYLFHNDGYKTYGWTLGKWGRKYYFDPSFGGGMVTGFRKVGNAHYYFDTYDGYSYAHHVINDINGKRWYFDINGIGSIY